MLLLIISCFVWYNEVLRFCDLCWTSMPEQKIPVINAKKEIMTVIDRSFRRVSGSPLVVPKNKPNVLNKIRENVLFFVIDNVKGRRQNRITVNISIYTA